MYYVQDSRQIVGNSMLWWRKGGGYTCDLQQAELFLKEDAEKIHANRETDKPWPVKYIDSLIQHHVDIQTVKAQQQDSADHIRRCECGRELMMTIFCPVCDNDE